MLLKPPLTLVIPHNSTTQAPLLAGMHRDRASQFKDRLGWSVEVDENGQEHDEYDTHYSSYIVAQNAKGAHLGSLRLRPLSAPTMLFDHFYELVGNLQFDMSGTLECTRFCLAPQVSGQQAKDISVALFSSLGQLSLDRGISRVVAIFEKQMIRIYKSLGVTPNILSQMYLNGTTIFLGEWTITEQKFNCYRNPSNRIDLSRESEI